MIAKLNKMSEDKLSNTLFFIKTSHKFQFNTTKRTSRTKRNKNANLYFRLTFQSKLHIQKNAPFHQKTQKQLQK